MRSAEYGERAAVRTAARATGAHARARAAHPNRLGAAAGSHPCPAGRRSWPRPADFPR